MFKKRKEKMTLEAARLQLVSLCVRGEQCEADLKLKMMKWGFSKAEAEKEILFLYDNDFLNEERYANAYCHDKLKFSGWGKIKIRAGLSLKKISSSIIASALDAIDEDEYMGVIRGFIKAKARELDLNSYNDRQKLIRSAYARGFEPSVVSKEISKLMYES